MVAGRGIDHHVAASAVGEVAGAAPTHGWDPHDIIGGGGLEDGFDVVVTVQAGGQHMIEPGRRDFGQVVVADQPPVSHHGDASDPEAVLQILQHRGQGGGVVGVAGEHVMGDGDPIAGDQQPDHHLGPVGAAITRVPEPAGRELLATGGRRLEVGRGQVVAAQPQIQPQQGDQLAIQVGLDARLQVGDGVQRPVELIERRDGHPGGELHVGVEPFGDGASFRPR